jgi:hypothetical protein
MHAPFRHPLATYPARAILGYRRDGRPIYPIAGGNGEGDGASGTADGTGADAGQTGTDGQQQATSGSQQAAGQKPDAAGSKDSGADLAATVARLEKDLAAARKDAGAARVNAKQAAADEAKAELAQQIGKALGLVADDTPPDPAKLTEQITTQTSRITELEASLRAKDTELAVHSLAEKHQAKVGSLLDSRSFVKAIRELDPASKTFTTDLDAAIKQAVADNPTFRSVPQAGRSGPDLTGGTGETAKPRSTSLNAAIRGHFGN